ncbi:MAG: hypothetical protein HOP29_00985 [Phycisphaerales bacterium]|nr:hypothetical protein [Phycisphaerales bacterium]
MAGIPPVDTNECVLGWHDSHGASAALVAQDGRIAFAAAEERYTRVKLQKGFPQRVVEDMSRRPEFPITSVCYTDLPLSAKMARHAGLLWHSARRGRNTARSAMEAAGKLLNRLSRGEWNGISGVDASHRNVGDQGGTLATRADGCAAFSPSSRPGFDALCEHHAAHAASAYYCSGFENAAVLTVDGVGDCLSGTLHRGVSGHLHRTHQFYYNELTVGADYEVMTALLGFDPDRHCGKLTGLAAYGHYDETCVQSVKAFFDASWRRGAKNYFDLLHGAGRDVEVAKLHSVRQNEWGAYSREQLAFAIQHLSETRILDLIVRNVSDIPRTDIAMAGGVFANVRINQKVKALGFRSIFIQPAMDDTGLSVGAALHHLAVSRGLTPRPLPHVFVGPSYDDARLADALDRAGVKSERVLEMPAAIASLLAGGNVVARFEGAMEFGPRALGNRSILCDARNPEVNDWLNRRLRRTEFMPFAPATLAERADDYYRNCDGCRHAAEFMTITFDCTDRMKQHSPAVVHVDGTARPQLVTQEANPGLYEVLREYHERTGIGSIVNTSFNMHESPIVNTPEDAVAAFRESQLDYLAIGPFLVSRDQVHPRRRAEERPRRAPVLATASC